MISTENSTDDTAELPTEFDVVIIGYGPAGATVANLLGQRGYSVAIIEQEREIYDKPRAITADHEVMRVFQECGLAEEIAQRTAPHPGTDFIGMDDQVIKRFYPLPPPNPLSWDPAWMFVQPELEATLRRGVARFDQIEVFLEHKFVDLAQHADHVELFVRRLDDAALIPLRARYVVACDGARSPVRGLLELPVQDLAFNELWLVVDAWLEADVELPTHCVQYCRPSRPATLIIGPNNLRRWEIKLMPGEVAEDFQFDEQIFAVLSDFVDVTALQICRSAVYRFHALVVEQWRVGRIFLMGDAAHQMPPFLGQGLCAAIRDTVNFVWKLDAVEKSGAADQLLNTYGAERVPHVRTVVSHAKDFGLIIGELDEEAARKRDVHLGALLSSGKSETVRQNFIPDLVGGLIDLDMDGRPGPAAGTLFVQPWVRDLSGFSHRLDDIAGAGFFLVSDGSEVVHWLDPQSRVAWRGLNGRQIIVLPEQSESATQDSAEDTQIVYESGKLLHNWLQTIPARVVLVRPDRYVYGAARSAAELKRLVHNLSEFMFPIDA